MPRKVLALDPALNNFGYAYPDGTTFTFRPRDKDRRIRLAEHYHCLTRTIEGCRPDMVIMEGPSYGSTKFAHTTVQLGELRGIILLATVLERLPLIEIAPKTLKKFATDNGNADKRKMMDAAIAESALIKNDNEADAWWLRQMALMRYGEADVNDHAFRLGAITDIAWPM